MSLLRSGIISRAGGQRNPGYETRLGGIGSLSGIAVPEMSPLFAEIVWFNKNICSISTLITMIGCEKIRLN